MKKLNLILELCKVNITLLVIVTCYIGFYLGLRSKGLYMIEFNSWYLFLFLLVGVFFTSSGASALNQYIERDYDSMMDRTKNRPIPLNLIKPNLAIVIGVFFSIFGLLVLYFFINTLTAIISLITILTYLFVYTPLKRITSLNTIVGSIPGALPPLGGWAAATNEVDIRAFMLFGILFCWQIPHFLSLAIIYKDDYRKGGFKMLPSITDNVSEISFQIIFFTMALLYTSIGIFYLNVTSYIYVVGAVLLGLIFLFYSSSILFNYSNEKIKRIFIFSIIYLPLLLILIVIDTIVNG
ncbi:MAG: protoheme IX farnesyltransferase [Candidatus Marinimicrobia bacterium]|nr:protoheme IX farnesyltransferase [Candidatus Neomarinimicrobiota bacterium]|tara:strand:+ start:843 stop:1727 length:885 start_codon:yes stop_codon:yes gene_type:complete